MRVNMKVRAIWLTVGLGGAAGCESPVEPLSNGTRLSAGPFIVSSPLPSPGSAAPAGSAGATLVSTVVYISLRPGAIANGVSANIRNLRTGDRVTEPVVAGGFDPVALPAAGGDTIAIDVRTATGGTQPFRFTARLRARPTVVRTDPPGNKRDVSLNARVVMVFSVPIDGATLNGSSVQLWQGTTPVAGTVRFADSTHLRGEFEPGSLLAPQTGYQLLVTTEIADLDGLTLDSAIAVPFTTGTTAPATGLLFASVSAGGSHTCGVTTGGAAYCWGANGLGELGDGTMTDRLTPVLVAGGLSFTAVSAGGNNACGVTATGAAYCWGYPGFGEDGIPTPVLVPGGQSFTAVSAGVNHTCGVTAAAAAYCWGGGFNGELGDGTPAVSDTPVPVAGGLSFTGVSAGLFHTCGVTTAGAAYCWGANDEGELGDGATIPGLTPVLVAGGLSFAAVSAGYHHSCGVTTAGAAYCWGENAEGQLGDGTTTLGLTPVPVAGGLSFIAVTAGGTHSCGRTAAATYCWGENYDGQLGDGTGPSVNPGLTPMLVAGGLNLTAVSAGAQHTCGTAAAAYCWGTNAYGQLGTGNTTDSNEPVKVAGQP